MHAAQNKRCAFFNRLNQGIMRHRVRIFHACSIFDLPLRENRSDEVYMISEFCYRVRDIFFDHFFIQSDSAIAGCVIYYDGLDSGYFRQRFLNESFAGLAMHPAYFQFEFHIIY